MEGIKRDKYAQVYFILIFVSLWMTLITLSFAECEFSISNQENTDTKANVFNAEAYNISTDLIKDKYENLDNIEEVQLIQDIEASTPLDIEASSAVVAYSRKFNIQPSLLLAMIEVESNFDKKCVGTHQDRGYLQIIPPTEKWLIEVFGEELGIEYDPQKIFDPDYNIGLGAAYISLLKNAYGEDINRILSEYNRGPYNLKKFYEKHNTYETSYSRSILSREKKYKQFDR